MKILTLILALFAFAPLNAAEEISYAEYHKALQLYVKDGWVDYAGLKKDQKDLKQFLSQAATLKQADFDQWSKQAQLAFYINLYNAVTLKLIVDHYPIASIRKIGNILKGPWKQEVVSLFGEITTLDHLEHGIIRKMGDARIHFAINCASIGCPKLISEPYLAQTLDSQLQAAAEEFIQDKEKNTFQVDQGMIEVSPLFKWFKSDFETDAGNLRQYLFSIVPKELREFVRDENNEIEFGSYDWNLNGIENRP